MEFLGQPISYTVYTVTVQGADIIAGPHKKGGGGGIGEERSPGQTRRCFSDIGQRSYIIY